LTGAGVTAPRVVVAGGHSAGHIEPAMNFADALRRLEPTAEITALGTIRGLETTLIPARGYQLELIPPVPLPRTLNRAARQRFGLRPEGPVLMVTGGSQGARAINAAVSGSAAALRGVGVQVLHITGPQHAVEVPDGHPAGPPYVVIPYVEEMQYAYAAADFVICRSGAMTCAELAAVGLPAAYVPLPLRGGEQRLNAEPAVAAGGALLVGNADLDPAWIETTLIPVLTDPGRIAAMSARASAAGAPDADVVLARYVLTAVAERRVVAP
jgi:UDP-N-acetylglucosamine--N-acetylmuramyl-(pentapeptide) pyrophosphoryl-undecaprenol N-acetylglucosamine transferase